MFVLAGMISLRKWELADALASGASGRKIIGFQIRYAPSCKGSRQSPRRTSTASSCRKVELSRILDKPIDVSMITSGLTRQRARSRLSDFAMREKPFTRRS